MKLDKLYESLLSKKLLGKDVIDVNDLSDFPRYITNYFNNPQYFIREKNIKIDVVEMNTNIYIREAKKLLKNSWGSVTSSRSSSDNGRNKVEIYAEKMKNGNKFPLPYLNYIDNSQQGMHRAEAALLVGVQTIPVAVIKNARDL